MTTDKKSSADKLENLINDVKKAQEVYATYTQQQVDKIFKAASLAACKQILHLSKMAVEETGMGIVEDKVIKNLFAGEFIYNKYKDTKTCDIIEENFSLGTMKIAEPLGVIAGIIPTTNPTSTAIFKSLISLKTRNGIIFSPHPRAKKCTVEAVKIVYDAAVKAGAPENILGCIKEPSIDLTNQLMGHQHINMILATGGPGMVKAAYSSGKPAIGVGAGNVPVVIDEFASVKMSVTSILASKTFDNGVICASEQSVTVVKSIYDDIKKEFVKRGAYILSPEEKKKLSSVIVVDGHLNGDIVGQYPWQIAKMAGLEVPKSTKVLIGECKSPLLSKEPFAFEKLSPVLALYKADNYKDAIENAFTILSQTGIGHTSVYYTNQSTQQERINYFGQKMKTGRILINMPSSQGAIGDVFNFELAPSLTLGCGSWGGNSVSENVGVKHLLNTKLVAGRRDNMLCYRVPERIYYKYGCLQNATKDIVDSFSVKRAFVVANQQTYQNGTVSKLTAILNKERVDVEVFSDVEYRSDLKTAKRAADWARSFKPDMIISCGTGSAHDTAKLVMLLNEYPDCNLNDLSMRVMDMAKRVIKFPKLSGDVKLVSISTKPGSAGEVTPFILMTDTENNEKLFIADYQLTPEATIVDPEITKLCTKEEIIEGGLNAFSHAIESLVSVMSTEFTQANSKRAMKLIYDNILDAATEENIRFLSLERLHYASTIAGMAYANTSLGLINAIAGQLSLKYNITPGTATALAFAPVVKYNSSDAPTKFAVFPQYKYPKAKIMYSEVVKNFGIDKSDDDDKNVEYLIRDITTLFRKLAVPASVQEIGINEEQFKKDLDSMAEGAFADQFSGTNPRYPLISEIKELLLEIYYGK